MTKRIAQKFHDAEKLTQRLVRKACEMQRQDHKRLGREAREAFLAFGELTNVNSTTHSKGGRV